MLTKFFQKDEFTGGQRRKIYEAIPGELKKNNPHKKEKIKKKVEWNFERFSEVMLRGCFQVFPLILQQIKYEVKESIS